ncbi:MAG: MFS transporter [Bacteroidetes bacterium]|nr:MAG: MFS transporter [Bacteroidota bacterium]
MNTFEKDRQYYKFCFYGFLKNLRFFEAFLLLFFLESGLSFFQIGWLYAVREISRNLFEIPAGFISDGIGRKKTMVTSFSVYILGFLLFYFSGSFWLFVLPMILMAVGDAFRSGTHKAMIFDYLKAKGWADQKVTYYGHTRSWSQMGSAISALLAATVVFLGDEYRIIFLFSIVPYILDLINLATYPSYLNGTIAKNPGTNFRASLKRIWQEFAYTFRNSIVLKAIGNQSFYTGFYKSLKDYIQPMLQALAIASPLLITLPDKKRTSILIGLFYFGMFFLNAVSSRNSKNFLLLFSSQRTALNTSFLLGIGLATVSSLFYLKGHLIAAVLCFACIYFVENLRKPIGISFIAENIPSGIMASVLSVESQVHSITAAVLAPLTVWLADLFGIGYALLLICGVAILISPLIVLPMRGKD